MTDKERNVREALLALYRAAKEFEDAVILGRGDKAALRERLMEVTNKANEAASPAHAALSELSEAAATVCTADAYHESIVNLADQSERERLAEAENGYWDRFMAAIDEAERVLGIEPG